MEVAASGYVKEFEEEEEEEDNELEEFEVIETVENGETPTEEEHATDRETAVKEGNDNEKLEEKTKTDKSKDIEGDSSVKASSDLIDDSHPPSQNESECPLIAETLIEATAVEHPAFPEPFQDADEAEELAELVEDWSGIRSKMKGTSSVTSMSTIHPDIIKARVKKSITRKQHVQSLHRIRAKGEASAVTRKKRENKDHCRPDGIWGWDN